MKNFLFGLCLGITLCTLTFINFYDTLNDKHWCTIKLQDTKYSQNKFATGECVE